MLFNSLEFLFFFPVVIILYFLFPYRFRWLLLLISSYVFYMAWDIRFIVLILFSTIVDYTCGLKMGGILEKEKRKPYLWISLVSNLGLLFTFKYLNFFSAELNSIFPSTPNYLPVTHLILPMGISFYTFQTMSYTIDVYHGKIKPEKHLGIFALFVSFFPQLVAGPIERAANLLSQFRIEFDFDYKRVREGLLLMLWGFFKKIIIADRVALLVNGVYNQPHEYYGAVLILATLLFAFQIYCDFSGYSDIAIGAAKIMGYDLMKNFNRPYFSRSIREFWQRWHISLSTWFRDYLYIPLGGNRTVKWRWYYNLFITFLISGIWHGANWTFIMWGALHGIYLILGIVFSSIKTRSRKFLFNNQNSVVLRVWQTSTTFLLAVFAWIFFRANNIGDATYIVSNLTSNLSDSLSVEYWRTTLNSLNFTAYDLIISLIFIGIMELIHLAQENGKSLKDLFAQPIWIRWAAYYFLILSIVFFGVFEERQFIYFQF